MPVRVLSHPSLRKITDGAAEVQASGTTVAEVVGNLADAYPALKARLLDLPLVTLLGAARERVSIYGSGGVTSFSDAQMREQLGGWVAAGTTRGKVKIGTWPGDDRSRVRGARRWM